MSKHENSTHFIVDSAIDGFAGSGRTEAAEMNLFSMLHAMGRSKQDEWRAGAKNRISRCSRLSITAESTWFSHFIAAHRQTHDPQSSSTLESHFRLILRTSHEFSWKSAESSVEKIFSLFAFVAARVRKTWWRTDRILMAFVSWEPDARSGQNGSCGNFHLLMLGESFDIVKRY